MAVACEEPRVSEGEHLAELAVVELLKTDEPETMQFDYDIVLLILYRYISYQITIHPVK